MADTIARLNVVCGATDNASGILSGISGKLMALGAAAGVISGLAFIGKKSLDSFIEFDTAISKSMMMFDNFGEGVRGEVESTSRALSKELGYSAAEVAEGFYALGSAGISARDSLSMIEDISRFSMASGGELGIAEASETAMTAMKAFGLEASDVPHILDVLAYAGKKTNTNLSDLSQAFAYVAPAAGSFGMTVEEVSAALGMMSDVGIKGSSAGTALRRIITNLVAPTGQAAQAIEALNLQVYETGSSGNTLISSIASCQTEMDQYQMSINETTAALLGLEDAQRGFNIEYQTLQLERMRIEDRIKDEGREATEDEKKRLGEIESAQRDLRISMQENTVESLKLTDKQEDAKIEMGELEEQIEDTQIALEEEGGEMRDFADILADIVEGSEDLTPAQKDMTLSMLAGVRGISGLISLLGDGGDAYATFTGEMSEADGLVQDMSDFMAGSAGVKMDIFRQHIEDLAISLGEKLYPWVEKVIQFFYDNEDTIKRVGNWFLTIASAIASLLTGDWSGFKEKASSAMTTLWNAIKDFDWGGAWDKLISELSGIAKAVWNWITTYDWGGAWDTLVSALGGIAKSVYDWLKNYDWANAWDTLKSGLGDIAKGIYDALKGYDWSGAWENLQKEFGSSDNWAKGFETLGDSFQGLDESFGDSDDWYDAGFNAGKTVGNVFGNVVVEEFGGEGAKSSDSFGAGFAGRWVYAMYSIMEAFHSLGENVGSFIKGYFMGIGAGMAESLASGFESVWTGIANRIIGEINNLINAANIAIRGYNWAAEKIPLLPTIPEIPNIPTISRNSYTYDIPTDPFFNRYNTPYVSPSHSSMSTAAAEKYFASRFGPPFNDFILSGGRAFSFNPRDTLIGVKQPEQLKGGSSNTFNVSLTFQNVADETYIHKIGSMVEKSLRRVVA